MCARSTRSPGLPDRLGPEIDLLLVGINPGLRSAALGHHFAGHGNRFWRLMHESGLTPQPLAFADDARLPEFGIGLTNLVARPTRGIDTLRPSDYAAGRASLERKIRRARPKVVGLIGLTLARALGPPGRLMLGAQDWRLADCDVFVVPNPSGRNAHYGYRQMLEAYRGLAAHISDRRARPPSVQIATPHRPLK